MTTPLDEGQNPDDLGERPGVDLGDYPEFFAYGGARGAEQGPARGGAQPGTYQGYEDYLRRSAEPEPPLRSRSRGGNGSGPDVPDGADGAAEPRVPAQADPRTPFAGPQTPMPTGQPLAPPAAEFTAPPTAHSAARSAAPDPGFAPGAPGVPGGPNALSSGTPTPTPTPPMPAPRQFATPFQAQAPDQAPVQPPAPVPAQFATQLPTQSTAYPGRAGRDRRVTPPPARPDSFAPAYQEPVSPEPIGAEPAAAEPADREPAAEAARAAGHRLTGQGPGRRRAKRSLASYLWPFRALTARPMASTRIRSRSTAATVWRRLKADRLALAGAVAIVVLLGLAIFADVVDALLGVDPTTLHPQLTDPILGPHGTFGGMSLAHPLGVDPSLGRDVLARLLSGARVSLLVAFAATLLAVGIGTVLGVVAGYLGGRVDAVITRLADLFLAFPLFLFALGLTGALSDKAFGLSGNGLRIAVMIFVMGFFNWPYMARIVRAEVLSLREREFIDAARALGARRRWIIGRELMPNLLSPILVYATLLIPTNIIFEAGLSALGVGLNPPAASWGQMMLDASRTVYTDPAYLIVPGVAVFITVLAFNLFGDGLRDALDPTGQ